VIGVRRTFAIVAFVLPLLSIEAASAHACALPVEVAVGKPVTVTVGITAEVSAVTAVEVGVPAGFRLTGAAGNGWRTETQGGVVRFDGSSVAPYSCGYVTLDGVAEETAKLAFPLTLLTEDGDTVTYGNAEPYRENSAQLVYAGLELPGLAGSDDGGPDLVVVVPLAAGSALAVASGVGWLRSRRSTARNS
jgi:hypothetical protein